MRGWRKWLAVGSTTLVLIAVAIYGAFKFTPWPGALLIRREFTKGGLATAQALAKHVPEGVAELRNESYRSDDADARLDVFFPEKVAKTSEKLPTLVWIHGGAWVAGDKDEIANYLKILASRGYTVVSLNYSLSPERHYPRPIEQIHDALRYIDSNADRLHVDARRICVAGDSAGSQMAAQTCATITNSDYAAQVPVKPGLEPSQLKGVLLNCGAYDLDIPDYTGPGGAFYNTVLWAYSGQKDFLRMDSFKTFSVLKYVTKDFPPTFITVGNADFLKEHSLAMARRLEELKVPVDKLFFPDDHQPELPHEYQFNLDGEDGKIALDRMTDFLAKAYAASGP